MKICIFSLYKSENLGEMAYTECVKKMIESRIPGVEIQYVDIHGRDANSIFREPLLAKIFRKIHFFSIEKAIRNKAEEKFLKNYYISRVKDSTAVIIPGGGYIKCTPKSMYDRDYRYNIYFDIMSQVCDSYNIGIYFNAVGHTINRNEENEIRIWKEVFSNKAIKYLSCRDELDFFKKVYSSSARQVCCSAAFIADYFKMEKDINSNTIGIGVIRPDAFSDYGINLTEETLVNLYKSIINILKKEYEIKLFTNGLKRDYQFGMKIAQALGDESIMIKRPEQIGELLQTISSFKAVIVSRMHAAIIAYSFDIPAVCLCWNNKHMAFMEGAGATEWAISPDNFNSEYIVSVINDSIKKGWPVEKRLTYRQTAIESMDCIVSMILQDN